LQNGVNTQQIAQQWANWTLTPVPPDVAFEWLSAQGIGAALMGVLGPVLRALWAAAWAMAAVEAARLAGGGSLDSGELYRWMNAEGPQWVAEITRTRMREMAQALSSGGSAEDVAKRLRSVLGDMANAARIAVTEVIRAAGAAAGRVYQAAGVQLVRWVHHSADPCPNCLTNEAAGPWVLGVPFPGGGIAPPLHPRCQCSLVPA
jgi:hypothetical protein